MLRAQSDWALRFREGTVVDQSAALGKDAAKVGTGGDSTMSLLKWALIFFVISIIAALFGFTDIAAATADVARILFYIFLVIFIVLLVLGLVVSRRF
jgi:uncharacterized membrane protein YtjA (UPF0391 family)